MGILTVGGSPSRSSSRAPHAHGRGRIAELHKCVDTLLIIPNQNLFRSPTRDHLRRRLRDGRPGALPGVACITDLMVRKASSTWTSPTSAPSCARWQGHDGHRRSDRRGARSRRPKPRSPTAHRRLVHEGRARPLISITGGRDLAVRSRRGRHRIREEVDQDANIIVGATFDESLGHHPRVGGRHRHDKAAVALPRSSSLAPQARLARPAARRSRQRRRCSGLLRRRR